MKKLISFLLALMMTLTLSLGAFAEETTDVQEILDNLNDEQKSELLALLLKEVLADLGSEEETTENRAAEAPAYASFGEHLKAFAENLKPDENDIQVNASYQNQVFSAVVGRDENGFHGKLQSGENVLGMVKVDDEAAYLTSGSMTYGVKFEELGKLLEKLQAASAVTGIKPEELQADLMRLAGWGMGLFMKVQPAFSVVQVSETERKITVDSAAFAEAFAAGVDEILADEAFGKIIDRYAGLLASAAQASGQQFPAVSAEQLKASWDGIKAQLTEMISQVEMELSLRDNEQENACSFLFAIPGGQDKIVFTADGAAAKDFSSGSVTFSVAGRQNPDEKLMEGYADYAKVGNGADVSAKINVQGQVFEMNESVRMDMENSVYTLEETVTVNGEKAMDLNVRFNWSNFTFEMTENVYPTNTKVYASFDGVTLTAELTQGEHYTGINVWGEEADVNHWTLHGTLDQDGVRQAADLNVAIVPMDPEQANEPEVLIASVSIPQDNTDLTIAQLQIGAVARSGEFEIDQAKVTWLDANALEAMLKMLMPQQPAQKAPAEAPAEEPAPVQETVPVQEPAPAEEPAQAAPAA